MMLYKNTKEIVHSSDGNTNFFEFVTWVLQGDTIAKYTFIICLDYGLRTSVGQINENGSTLRNSRR